MPSRLLTINLRKYLVGQPRRKRPMRVSSYVKYRIAKSINIKTDNIRISKELNSVILKKYVGSMKPLKVNINIEKEIATVTPFEAKAVSTDNKKEQSANNKAAAVSISKTASSEAASAKPKE